MALTHTQTITQEDGGEIATYLNTTVYGGANQDRNEAAEILLWSKTDKTGSRTFYNPEQGNVLTKLEYELSTGSDAARDGHYEAIRVRVQLYDVGANYMEEQEDGGGITQYASLFYYATTGKFYKAIVASSGQDPEDTDYFEEVPYADLKDHLENTNIEVAYEDFACSYRIDGAIRDLFADGDTTDANDIKYRQRVLYMKQSADSNFANGAPEVYEKIIRDLETTLASCL